MQVRRANPVIVRMALAASVDVLDMSPTGEYDHPIVLSYSTLGFAYGRYPSWLASPLSRRNASTIRVATCACLDYTVKSFLANFRLPWLTSIGHEQFGVPDVVQCVEEGRKEGVAGRCGYRADAHRFRGSSIPLGNQRVALPGGGVKIPP